MTEIYFVRHGQASFGAENYDKLSTIGHKQSELLGLHLKKTSLKFDKVICGKMKRHQETLEEINVEARELFIENGGESFEYIPCLNDNKHSIKFLEYIIKQNLLGWNH